MSKALGDMASGILEGMDEAIAHVRGEPTNVRATGYEFADAKAIRENLGLSQMEFSEAYGIPVQSLRHWEQRRHNPDRTASAYLWTIEAYPDLVRKAQAGRRMSASQEQALNLG